MRAVAEGGSQWSYYSDAEMQTMRAVVNGFLAKLKVVFPVLDIDASRGPHNETVAVLFMEVKRQLCV